jgi:FdhD protein
MSAGAVNAARQAWRAGRAEPGERTLAEETAIALVHDATTTAVMMATPADLEDFGVGFSLTERLVDNLDELHDIDIVPTPAGVEVRMWLSPERAATLAARRRRLAGPTGCGLCGVDSLAEAVRPPMRVGEGAVVTSAEVLAALEALGAAQALGAETRAVHAAGFWSSEAGLGLVREDVGRHNALDKLAGALARAGTWAGDGAVILTSRVSVEMVQKTAAIGAPILIAISAPTSLAVSTAETAGITLVAVARRDGFEVFTRPDRISA